MVGAESSSLLCESPREQQDRTVAPWILLWGPVGDVPRAAGAVGTL